MQSARSRDLSWRRHAARATAAACAAAAAIALALLGLPLVFGHYYYGLDQTQTNVGLLCAIERLLAQDAPLWLSPAVGNGAPLLTRPEAALFYPVRWLALLLPPDAGASLEAVLHLALAAAGATWLGRTFGLRPAAALAAGLATAFSGSYLDLLLHTSIYPAGGAWLPWVWAAARRALHPGGRAGALVTTGVALAAILLGGELQSFCAALAIVGAEIAIRLWRHRRRALGRCLRQALALLAGALAGNGPWLGFLAEERLTQRFGPLDLAQAAHWSFEPALWPALLLPGRLFSVPLPHTSLWLMAQRGPLADTAWNPAPYLGLLLFAALATACWQRGTRLAAVCAGTGLLLALGDTTPLFSSLVALLPPLALFRYPAKYLVVTTLACCVVAMVGLQRLRRRPAAWRRFMIAGLVLLAGGALAALAVTVWRDALDTLTRDLGDHAPAFDWPPLAALLRWSLLRALLPLAAALLLGALWRSGRRWLPWIAVADLMLAGLGAVQLGPPLARLDSPLEALGTGRDRPATVLCVADEPEPDPTAVGATSNWALLALRRQYGSVELQACGGLSNACGYGTLQSSANRLLQAAMMLGHASAARALGCTHVITGGSGDGQGPGHPTVVAVDSPIPTAFVARSPRLVASDEELLWRIYATTSAAQALAVVDDPLRRISRLVDLPPGDSVEIDSADWPTRDRATLRLRGSGGAVVGLRTSFQVGWQAHQAGRALPVIRTSGQHVAAVVDDARAGPIELEYRSPLLAAGCALSPLGALGLAGLALWRPRRGGRA